MKIIDLSYSSMRNSRARSYILQNPITFVFVVVFICCVLVLIMTILKLPEVNNTTRFRPTIKKNLLRPGIGKFGNMILEMLPKDLAFTVFLPSDRAFYSDLGLNVSKSLEDKHFHDTYAILTRILGFSVVPRKILSVSVVSDEELIHDSISGYPLYMSKDVDGNVIVNRIRSEQVDIRIGEIVVHIMDGVVMDSEFEQSVKPDEDEDQIKIKTNI